MTTPDDCARPWRGSPRRTSTAIKESKPQHLHKGNGDSQENWLLHKACVLNYCNRTKFCTWFNFVYFILLAGSTKFSSIRKPYTYTSVSDTTVAIRKFLVYENWQMLEYEIFTPTKISAITVDVFKGKFLDFNFSHDKILLVWKRKTMGRKFENITRSVQLCVCVCVCVCVSKWKESVRRMASTTSENRKNNEKKSTEQEEVHFVSWVLSPWQEKKTETAVKPR